ncbi:hypothetical protein V1260_13700 [Brachybacterium sp. J144]|uniref:hypothetical protein n=1 Tax=Brachybacterium sp. J144 TaxID=3116487 RepID=UPI002E7826DD|nr:hypothetical protein [Brachybacterium sp. J144]MEE1651832.1 hypothetical protein [Brachybacterium sp. J144]
MSLWRAAMVDLEHEIGVAVEIPPPCDCAPCLLAWWDDRASWEGDLLSYGVAVVELLPDEPGRLACMHLALCEAWDADGREIALWTPDGLPIHRGGAAAVGGHPVLAGLWAALEELVRELDGAAAR